jgi:hypothetical protein
MRLGTTPRTFAGRLVARLLAALGNPPVELVLWNGERLAVPGAAATVARVHLKDRGALCR